MVPMFPINFMFWKCKSVGYLFMGLLGFYFLFIFKWSHRFVYEDTIKNSKPKQVWDFVADFSNMMKLNPTLEEFDIIDDTGNYDHWKYSVQYTEHLHHIPIIKNFAHGHFSVTTKGKGYVIESEHDTCFFGIRCLKSYSEFIFLPEKNDTKCIEEIQYECPLAFSCFCKKEVMYQRKEIMKNLQSYFSTIAVEKR